MPDIKLRDGSGVENTYQGVDTITLPLADGSGNWIFGLTDEDLTFKYEQDGSVFTTGMAEYVKRFKKYLNRFDLSQLYTINYMFSKLKKEDTPYVENYKIPTSENYPKVISGLFSNTKINKLPKFDQNGVIVPNFNNLFENNYGYHGEQIHGNEINAFLNSIKKLSMTPYYYLEYNSNGNNTRGSFNFSRMFYENENLTNVLEGMKHIQELINNLDQSTESMTLQPSYDSMYDGTYNMYYYFFPVVSKYQYNINTTNNIFYSALGYYPTHYFGSRIIFGTDKNNQPIQVNWKNQTLETDKANYCFGWSTASPDFIITKSVKPDDEKPYTLSEQVMYNEITNTPATTIEEAKEQYDKVKNSGRPYACDSSVKVNYDGAQRYLALLFSNYNHDSAVETINSLPDASEYLATAGGTNTIRFKNYSGACTDAGGTNDLTAAEIQVATDKGWTVTFID